MKMEPLPSLSGRVVVVTGANSGIGYYTALGLAQAGAMVVLACRSAEAGMAAAQAVNRQAPGHARFMALDLASLASVRGFAAGFGAAYDRLDVLVNNAGIMALPRRQLTADGFEAQIGVNFLGHFALTARLLPILLTTKGARTVQLSSIAHRPGRINLDDLMAAKLYHPWRVYEQSKLAMLMFALELQRRADAAGWGLTSLAAHPGVARTQLMANGPGQRSIMNVLMTLGTPFVTQSAAAGALPVLLAAAGADVVPGGYYGPTGLNEFRGRPGVARISPHALDTDIAKSLWAQASTLTGEDFTAAP
ncbi:MAG: oxidoreductase [Acidocella sp.]|nr:oxidoreductase [Acidocella sp.]